MKNSLLALLLFTLLCSGLASAATLRFDPPYKLTLGEEVSIGLVLDGLDATAGPLAGAFDITIAYDPSIIRHTSLIIQPGLGDEAAFEVLTSTGGFPGEASLSAVSLLDYSALAALQTGSSLRLATLVFTPWGVGVSPLTITSQVVSGLFPNPSSPGAADVEILPVSLETGAIEVQRVVPEPGTWAFLGLGLATLAAVSRRGRHQD
ncbi:MAG: PEP-CTERM sorting domain-containing protein [Acidobacteria bacterium]|nr:PEP-CTERM sorting domain-containing protein [Acidobacteriota bacterium]